ncbi:MAG: hypothetical protein IOC54_16355 [Methylobacterium sp.]|nr:hypothetical protein [Methylobacterium sp.]
MPQALDPDYLTRQARVRALQCSVAEILTAEIATSAMVSPETAENCCLLFHECDRMALSIARHVLLSLYPWGGTIDVEQALNDLQPIGPLRPHNPADDPF